MRSTYPPYIKNTFTVSRRTLRNFTAMNKQSDNEQQQQLNLETGQLHWQELQRHFARGVVITVNNELDLVEVAFKFTRDDKETIETWLDKKLVSRASDDDAKHWEKTNASFWAIVVAPWVIVQEITEH